MIILSTLSLVLSRKIDRRVIRVFRFFVADSSVINVETEYF